MNAECRFGRIERLGCQVADGCHQSAGGSIDPLFDTVDNGGADKRQGDDECEHHGRGVTFTVNV